MIHTQFNLQVLVEDLFIDIDTASFPYRIDVMSDDASLISLEIDKPKRQHSSYAPPINEEHWIYAILDKAEVALPIMKQHKLEKMRQHVEFNWGNVPYACTLDIWFNKPVEVIKEAPKLDIVRTPQVLNAPKLDVVHTPQVRQVSQAHLIPVRPQQRPLNQR